jgi:hypothetical protein
MPSPFSYTLESLQSPSTSAVQEIVATSLYGLSLDATGDLELDDQGALRWTDGPEQARQEAECRLQFFLGEYFLDIRQGLPYYRVVLRKNPNKEAVRSMFARAITSVPGLIEANVGYSLDTATRKLTVPWEARWIDGQPVTPVKPLEVLI